MFADEPLVSVPLAGGGPTRLERATRLARLIAARLDLPEPHLERVSMNAVFRSGPAAIRVCAPTTDPVVSLRLAPLLIERGITVARPFDDRSFHEPELDPELRATVWEYVEHDPSVEPDWGAVGRMIRELHGIDPTIVADIHPLPLAGRFAWWNVAESLDRLGDALAPDVVSSLRAAHDRLSWVEPFLRDPDDGFVVVHGDLHPGNVVVDRRDGRSVVLDWDLVSLSNRAWDHAPLMRWSDRWGGRAGCYEAFAGGYGEHLDDRDLAHAISELRLLVATIMRARAAVTDPRARDEAERRIGYWSGSDTRMWTAV